MPLTTGKNPCRIVGAAALRKYIAKCSSSILLDGEPPPSINFLEDPNPYKGRYGDNWENEIRKSKFHKNYCCVTDLVKHIMDTSSGFFKHTEYAGKWYIYHDALVLMTEKGCVKWMENTRVSELDTQTYYECWILPQLGLNDNISRYGGRPVENCPELMPWDARLNRDSHETVRRHSVLLISYSIPCIISYSTSHTIVYTVYHIISHIVSYVISYYIISIISYHIPYHISWQIP